MKICEIAGTIPLGFITKFKKVISKSYWGKLYFYGIVFKKQWLDDSALWYKNCLKIPKCYRYGKP